MASLQNCSKQEQLTNHRSPLLTPCCTSPRRPLGHQQLQSFFMFQKPLPQVSLAQGKNLPASTCFLVEVSLFVLLWASVFTLSTSWVPGTHILLLFFTLLYSSLDTKSWRSCSAAHHFNMSFIIILKSGTLASPGFELTGRWFGV